MSRFENSSVYLPYIHRVPTEHGKMFGNFPAVDGQKQLFWSVSTVKRK